MYATIQIRATSSLDGGVAGLACGPAIVGCAVVGVVALDNSTEGVRLGLIERLGGRKEDVGGVDGGGVDATDEKEEGLETLVEGRR